MTNVIDEFISKKWGVFMGLYGFSLSTIIIFSVLDEKKIQNLKREGGNKIIIRKNSISGKVNERDKIKKRWNYIKNIVASIFLIS